MRKEKRKEEEKRISECNMSIFIPAVALVISVSALAALAAAAAR